MLAKDYYIVKQKWFTKQLLIKNDSSENLSLFISDEETRKFNCFSISPPQET